MGTLDPWINSSTGDGYRNSVVAIPGDGSKTNFDFNFGGGYIDKSHIKAYTYDTATGHTEVTPFTWLGPNTIQVVPAPATGIHVVIYRDTPKSAPLVNFSTNASMTEKNLDLMAQQAIFSAAEMVDRFDSINAGSSDAIERSVTALNTANTALANSSVAVSTANAANTTAGAANATASAANTKADNAVTTANAANATANGIDAKAQSALDNSNTANTNANNAVSTANSAAAAVGNKIDKNGTVAMAADLNLGTHKVINVVDPVNPQDAATRNFVTTMTNGSSGYAKGALIKRTTLTVSGTFAFDPKTTTYIVEGCGGGGAGGGSGAAASAGTCSAGAGGSSGAWGLQR
ncbi:phage tail fiber protein (plasmid) [Ralstonia syzygii subsp. celebesensis]|uniref:phage tail fiber domain-containing protein n=1 Tax=Ralstonia syzygii TaxID=28097 RepID=UPI00387E0646